MLPPDDTAAAIADPNRLAALAEYDILDTPPEPGFDDIVMVAAELCNTPVALVSLVDQDRQWFKSRLGFEACETPLDQSVCAHALARAETLVIPDLTADPRTQGNPLVTGNPHIRFYAGAPLIAPRGHVLGTLCVIDTVPRPDGLAPRQQQALEALARQVVALLKLRRAVPDRDVSLTVQRESGAEVLARAIHGEAEQARIRAAQEAGAIGTFVVDVATGKATVSAEMCRIFGVPVAPTYPASTFEVAVVPDDRAVPSNAATRQDGSAVTDVEYRIHRVDDGRLRWVSRRAKFERNEAGRTVWMIGTVTDITEQRLATDRVGALLELGDRLREVSTSAEAVGVAAEILGRTLGAGRASYATIDTRGGRFRVERDWTTPGVASIAGDYPLDMFPATIRRLESGRPLVTADVLAEAELTSDAASYRAIGTRGQIKIPLIIADDLVGVLFVHASAPRVWSAEEITFAKGLADRTYAALAKLRAESEQQVLNIELSHRLKNTLAMVQAIAIQTLRPVNERDAVESFMSRLLALSKAHDVLLQQSWSEARIRAVVTGVLHGLGPPDRLDIDGPDISFGPRATLSLSLLLHELATNALKYGALSNTIGRVSVRWRVERSSDEAILVLEWRERGGPPVAEPSRRGFGSRLIRLGLVGTGGVTIRYSSLGFEAVMTAPVSQVEQS
ncbi:GAF domain-containing protein [Methylobacterium oryzisoli]|uniref:GAF domain-containing protein n=1 Tax=Methylobacterium oryzisoli TaxID=3385502 RepID=UPI0038927205